MRDFREAEGVELMKDSWWTAPNDSRPATCVIEAGADTRNKTWNTGNKQLSIERGSSAVHLRAMPHFQVTAFPRRNLVVGQPTKNPRDWPHSAFEEITDDL